MKFGIDMTAGNPHSLLDLKSAATDLLELQTLDPVEVSKSTDTHI
jgi:hypothetical protein